MQFVFLLIRSILKSWNHFHCRPLFSVTRFIFFCLHVLLTRVSLLALAKSIYYIFVIYSTHHFHTYVHCTWIIFLLFISQSNTCHIQLNVLLWLKWKKQPLVYPLIGQIWQIISTLSKRVVPVTQKDGVRRRRTWNRGIHDNFFVERMIARFPAHRSAEEGTEDLPCELGARKKSYCNPADRLRSRLITKWQ